MSLTKEQLSEMASLADTPLLAWSRYAELLAKRFEELLTAVRLVRKELEYGNWTSEYRAAVAHLDRLVAGEKGEQDGNTA